MTTVRLLYFAWLRDHTGQEAEDFILADNIQTTGDVVTMLRARGAGYEAAFANPRLVRVAVNQVFADWQTPVGAGDEVAFFPPVTGG